MADRLTRRTSKRKADTDSEDTRDSKRRVEMNESQFERLFKELQNTKQTLQAGQADLNLRVEAVKDQVRAELGMVNGRISNVENTVTDLSERVAKVESMAVGGGGEKAFWIARRSFVCGPADEDSRDLKNQLEKILIERLKMREWEANALDVQDVVLVVRKRKVHANQPPIEMPMLRVTMRHVADRDRIFSMLGKADPNFRLELYIPNELVGKHRLMEKAAYDLRKAGFKTMIKFDDVEQDLQLMYRVKILGAEWKVKNVTRKSECLQTIE